MPKITLLVHNIRSTHNVGAIFRTAEGFGVEQIILSGYTPYPSIPKNHTVPSNTTLRPLHDKRLPHERERITAQIHKTALGAEAMVPFEYYELLDTWLCENQDSTRPLPVFALEQAPDSINLREFVPPDEFALLLGEEVHGITPHYLSWCDAILEIPMSGQKESFNVSVATGIALYALAAS